jgi:hypothetical protein
VLTRSQQRRTDGEVWSLSASGGAIIVMFHEASGKKKIRIASYLTSWNQADHQKSTERTGQGLSASGGLIQKIYEWYPLTCPKYQGRMRIIAFIEDPEVINKILKHLDLWNLKARPPPRANAPPNNIEPHLDYSHRGVGPYGPEVDSQLPPPARHRSRSGEFPNSGTRKRAGPTITSM